MSSYKWENLKVLADDDKTIGARKIAFNLLLDILVKNDFHPTDVDCDDEDINNYYSFYIKELPGWLFNVWFGEYREPGYLSGLLFTQYEEAAFKITPTRAKIQVVLEFGTFKNNIDTLFPKEKGEMLKVKANELLDLAKEKGTPVVEKAVEEVRKSAIQVTKEVLKKLERKRLNVKCFKFYFKGTLFSFLS